MWAVGVASAITPSIWECQVWNMKMHEAHLFGASLVPVGGPGHQRVKQDRLQKAAQGGGVPPSNSHDVLTASTEGSLHTGCTQRCLHGC